MQLSWAQRKSTRSRNCSLPFVLVSNPVDLNFSSSTRVCAWLMNIRNIAHIWVFNMYACSFPF